MGTAVVLKIIICWAAFLALCLVSVLALFLTIHYAIRPYPPADWTEFPNRFRRAFALLVWYCTLFGTVFAFLWGAICYMAKVSYWGAPRLLSRDAESRTKLFGLSVLAFALGGFMGGAFFGMAAGIEDDLPNWTWLEHLFGHVLFLLSPPFTALFLLRLGMRTPSACPPFPDSLPRVPRTPPWAGECLPFGDL